MSYKDITEGTKTGKALAARFVKSPEKGTPGIEVAFEFMEPSTGALERLMWIGWLSERAIENTMNVLTNILGCNGNEQTDENGVFKDPKFLDYGREVALVVELEKYLDKDNNEKFSPKIKWVNTLGGSKFANVEPETVKSELAQVGFKAAFLASRGSTGMPMPAKEVKNYAPQTKVSDEKLPF